MKITDITVEQIERAENAYREQHPDPVEAGLAAGKLEEKLLETTLAIPIGLLDQETGNAGAALALGIEIGLILAEQNGVVLPVVSDQAVS